MCSLCPKSASQIWGMGPFSFLNCSFLLPPETPVYSPSSLCVRRPVDTTLQLALLWAAIWFILIHLENLVIPALSCLFIAFRAAHYRFFFGVTVDIYFTTNLEVPFCRRVCTGLRNPDISGPRSAPNLLPWYLEGGIVCVCVY